MNLLKKKVINQVMLPFREFGLTSQRRNVFPEYFQTQISHLPVHNIEENVWYSTEVKTLAQHKMKMTSEKK